MNNAPPPDPSSEELPQVPGFGSWRVMYFVVLSLLVFYIALLAVWSRWLE